MFLIQRFFSQFSLDFDCALFCSVLLKGTQEAVKARKKCRGKQGPMGEYFSLPLECSSCFLLALRQNRVQSRLLYLFYDEIRFIFFKHSTSLCTVKTHQHPLNRTRVQQRQLRWKRDPSRKLEMVTQPQQGSQYGRVWGNAVLGSTSSSKSRPQMHHV